MTHFIHITQACSNIYNVYNIYVRRCMVLPTVKFLDRHFIFTLFFIVFQVKQTKFGSVCISYKVFFFKLHVSSRALKKYHRSTIPCIWLIHIQSRRYIYTLDTTWLKYHLICAKLNLGNCPIHEIDNKLTDCMKWAILVHLTVYCMKRASHLIMWYVTPSKQKNYILL